MGTSLAVALACLFHLSLAGMRVLRPPKGTGTAISGAATGMVVVAAATAAVLVNVTPVGLQIIAVGIATATALTTHWRAFHRGRWVMSFPVDTGVVCAETTAWTWTLLGLAHHLYPAAPFGAVLAGILGFFLPVNAAAEVFRAGRDSPRPED